MTIDGYEVVTVEPQADWSRSRQHRSSGPDRGDRRDRATQYTSGRGWVSFGPGTDPAYPG